MKTQARPNTTSGQFVVSFISGTLPRTEIFILNGMLPTTPTDVKKNNKPVSNSSHFKGRTKNLSPSVKHVCFTTFYIPTTQTLLLVAPLPPLPPFGLMASPQLGNSSLSSFKLGESAVSAARLAPSQLGMRRATQRIGRHRVYIALFMSNIHGQVAHLFFTPTVPR